MTTDKVDYGLLPTLVNGIYSDYIREQWDNDETNYDCSFDFILPKLKQHEFIFDKVLTKEDIPNMVKVLNRDTLYFTDFIFTEEGISRKEYEPYKTIFETSGKIIVENDLREFIPDDGSPDKFDINSTSGMIGYTDWYAKQGMLHGFVGNSCPGVFLSEELGEIQIGAKWDTELDDVVLPDDSFKEVTSICTDLWWYSIIDLEVFKKLNPDFDTSEFEIVDIPAGKWELTHTYGITNNSYHDDLPYATLKKI